MNWDNIKFSESDVSRNESIYEIEKLEKKFSKRKKKFEINELDLLNKLKEKELIIKKVTEERNYYEEKYKYGNSKIDLEESNLIDEKIDRKLSDLQKQFSG